MEDGKTREGWSLQEVSTNASTIVKRASTMAKPSVLGRAGSLCPLPGITGCGCGPCDCRHHLHLPGPGSLGNNRGLWGVLVSGEAEIPDATGGNTGYVEYYFVKW